MNKETIKEFLKPSKWKVLVFLIFLMFILYEAFFVGLPPGGFFTSVEGVCDPNGEHCVTAFGFKFNLFITSIFFSYLISCLIIFIYNKLKSEK